MTLASCLCVVGFIALTAGCKRDSIRTSSLSPSASVKDTKQEAMKQAITEKLNVSSLNDVSYAQVQQLPQKLQVFIFQNVDNACRARLWQEKISSIIAVTTDPARKSSLEELHGLFKAALYDHGPGNQASDPSLHQWADRNKTLFTEDEINVILLTLNKVEFDQSTKRYREAPKQADLFDYWPCPPYCSEDDPPVCLCNQAHHSAGCGTCQSSSCTTQWGCGYGGNETCNGRCSYSGGSGGGGGGGGGGGW